MPYGGMADQKGIYPTINLEKNHFKIKIRHKIFLPLLWGQGVRTLYWKEVPKKLKK
jgi:hypothetical protein